MPVPPVLPVVVSAEPPRLRWAPAAAGLTLAGLAVYLNSVTAPLVYDDVASILANPTIRRLWPLWGALSPPSLGGPTVAGRPVLNLSLAINYAISGNAAWSYHAVNVAIHLAAGLVLFGVVRRTLASGHGLSAAFAIALLWIVHPLQTEAVTYTIQRAESLMGLFYLLTLYCFVRGWFKLCWSACLLGMATKEVMVSAPVMVLLYDRTFLAGSFREAWRRHRSLYLGLGSTWVLLAYLVIGGGGNRGGNAGFNIGVAWPAYWLTQFPAVAHYLHLAIWPHPLVFDYGTFWIKNLGQVMPDAALVTLLAGAVAVALWRWPAWGFIGAWFFVILAPTSVVPGALQMIVEHRVYLPLAAPIAALVCGMDRLIGPRRPGLLLALTMVLAAGLGAATIRRNCDYASALALWADTAVKRPQNARAQVGLANELAVFPGRIPEAIQHYEQALRLVPQYPEAHNNLANSLAKLPGRLPEAIAHYEAALRLNPTYAAAHYDFANALAEVPASVPQALAHYQTALRLDPHNADVEYNLANALAKVPGRLPEAAAHYEAALQIAPGYAEAHNNLAVVLEMIPGRKAEALGHYRAALRINPGLKQAAENLAHAQAEERSPGRGP